LKLWSVPKRQEIATLNHIGPFNSVSFSPDGEILASGSLNHTVKLWSVSKHQVIATLEGHTGSIKSVSFSPDGEMLAVGTSIGRIKLWSVSGQELAMQNL